MVHTFPYNSATTNSYLEYLKHTEKEMLIELGFGLKSLDIPVLLQLKIGECLMEREEPTHNAQKRWDILALIHGVKK